MASMTKAQLFLMFERQAKETMRFYISHDCYGVWQLNLS
jgi:predicted 3-demethylubiquinone-9 3-methyltransferase (glyoxalase superfamily)